LCPHALTQRHPATERATPGCPCSRAGGAAPQLQVRIWLYAPLADRRKFSGGLTALVRTRLAENPL